MLKTMFLSLKIDNSYGTNSIIYALRKLFIFKDLFSDTVYNNKIIKFICSILSVIFTTSKMVLYKFLYFYIIYVLSHTINKGYEAITFIHIYFVFTLIGMFINNNLLSVSTKKYLSLIVFNMDANKYMSAYLWFNIINNLLLNIVGFIIINYFFVHISFSSILLLLVIGVLCRLVGEAWSINYYKKKGYTFIDNTTAYFILLGLFLIISFLPYFNFVLVDGFIFICGIVLFLISLISLRYLYSNRDYKLLFKRLNTKTRVMNSEEAYSYSRQAMVEVKNKDKDIDNKKLIGKKGYDLFNTIFFERHKEILTRSCYRFSGVLLLIYCFLLYFIFNGNINNNINNFLLNNLGWFVLIMYFINRGAVVTQAMFYNCDHAMLLYNFYREPSVILELFKKRVVTLVKINMIPSIIISLGNCLLLYFSGGASIITYISICLFIISLGIFFSVHYMVMYYLLQPYNQDLKIRKFSYSVVSFLTYFVSYMFTSFVMSSVIFSVFTVIFTIIYIIISCLLVYKFSPRTFRINR